MTTTHLHRALILMAALAAPAAFAKPLKTAATTPAQTAATPTPTTPAQGILLLGDSMMRLGVGPALKNTLTANGVFDDEHVAMHTKSATGLARPDVFDWSGELQRVFAKRKFAKAVVMLGSNDCQNLATSTAGKSKASMIAYGTPEWTAEYQARIDAMLTQLCAGAEEVLWLGLPPMRSSKFNARIKNLNQLIESKVTASSCATFVPAGGALADAKGGYAEFIKVKKRRLKVREADGIHITQQGGELVSEAVLAELQRE